MLKSTRKVIGTGDKLKPTVSISRVAEPFAETIRSNPRRHDFVDGLGPEAKEPAV